MRAIMWAATAGFPVGLAAGFKLTMAVYCVAFVLAALVVPRRWPERMQSRLRPARHCRRAVGSWRTLVRNHVGQDGKPIFSISHQVFQFALGDG